jgi:hypothetical protein
MSSIREIVTPSGVVVKVDRHGELNLINISANCGGTVTFTAIVNPLSWARFKRALATAERMMMEEGWLDTSPSGPEGGSSLRLVKNGS